ncbi:MAG: hypothetical protein KJ732_03035 [Candidatus Margulisbacteria bacterium]|nr:hypothetical protein [Candidatus Margulisiibacteriota bacterium]
MQEILINVLIFSGILLLLALAVGVIIGVMILLDVRKMTKDVTKKVKAVTSAIDIVSMLFGGFGGAQKTLKKKLKTDSSTMVAFISGLKKGLQVLLKKESK